ncbi:MAG: hypothetical protein KGL43_01405 [Burkholderiales bacterium]|nr:hypothetical protein [Burkholderiales bacterium]
MKNVPAALRRCSDEVQAIVLARQDEATGLLPASTAVTVHGDYTHAWVRDNVYSILCVWALALAWRGEDPAQAAACEASVLRLMRGLLAAMMKQAGKVERFKRSQDPLDALHAKYDPHSGEAVVGDDEWGHLQIDATAVYLLFVAQMSASGLPIVRNAEELAFVQNLVHYLAKAYRTPDYGIWERGHKRNEGLAELNASSLGMAKAALEAIAGCRLLGAAGAAIHVAPDDIARAREALQAQLPRESISKETDAALLAIVGFPAYAVEDAALAARTRGEIAAQLEGRYGCKRFLRDGHQTVLEDPSRLHYEPGELSRFEHIESEWPLFFAYQFVDAALCGDKPRAADYRRRLEALMVEQGGQRLLPELYYVPADAVEAERTAPGSQDRVPNDNLPLVWTQSLYIVGVLLAEGLVSPAQLDPLGRRLAPGPRREPRVQIVLLAEDALVQARLRALGIASERPAKTAAVSVRYARQLMLAFGELGRCEALGLTGRPLETPVGLATSRGYTLGAARKVFLPAWLVGTGFYLELDNRLLVDEIAGELAHLQRHWRAPGQPLLALLLAEPMLDAPGSEQLIAYLLALCRGEVAAARVERLEAAWAQCEPLAMDWLERLPDDSGPAEVEAGAESALSWEEAATRPLTPQRLAALARVAEPQALARQLVASRNPYEHAALLDLLWRREGAQYEALPGQTLRALAEALYGFAARLRLWGVLRRAAGLLDLRDEALEDALASLLVRGKRVQLGRPATREALIARPCSGDELLALIHQHGGEDGRARVLIQEGVLLLAMLVKADPDLVAGSLTLRVWHLIELVNGGLEREHDLTPAQAFDHLLSSSPHALLGRLREAMAGEQELTQGLRRRQALSASLGPGQLSRVDFSASADPLRADADASWRVWREASGVMARAGDDFHARVRGLLAHCAGLVIGDPLDAASLLDSALLSADTTPQETAFALQVDELLDKIQNPAYRQLSIEALSAVSAICRANPMLKIDGLLVVDVLLATAVSLNWQHATSSNADAASEGDAEAEDAAAAWALFYDSEPHRVANFVMEAFALLLHERHEGAAAAGAEGGAG